ncbi:hypothetical protein HMN09_00084500 [Mycena chlorophos]|uniref:Condensation domain-containing protein n=1 Tax=Mycena chlorophos TaxID=658473 RepID=A0A8H6TTI4_MYCCL|nr:hypothetical protein HMN09_00084500 [Mycena chlorophos]
MFSEMSAPTMASWTQTSTSSGQQDAFERPLGLNELGFFWDSRIQGTADSFSHSTLGGSPALFAQANVVRAWTVVKNKFPLLGARIILDADRNGARFHVALSRLSSLVPGEVTTFAVASEAAVDAAADAVINGQRKLSDNLLGRIEILTHEDKNADAPVVAHLFIHLAHAITDGVSGTILLRTFLEYLSSPEMAITLPDVRPRLALAVSAESLVPARRFTLARQRWRRAAGKIISQIQDAKREGGHTLPRSFGPIAARLPARSGFQKIKLSPAETLRLISTCRAKRITVGNALPVLAQVALARMLCRRYLRGEIGAEEWEFRRIQPSHTAGPINLRTFLDREWFDAGGAANVSVYIGYFYFSAPFTPLPRLQAGDPVPKPTELMTRERFVLRCNQMKANASKYLKHPLFFEIGQARLANKIPNQRRVAEMLASNEPFLDPSTLNLSPMEQAQHGPVFTHGWSTFGNTDANLPRAYPANAENPTLRLITGDTKLHCRPGELYLGSGTVNQELFFAVYFDKNVFTEHIVQEWLSEIRYAADIYLLDSTDTPKL